jgi:hypothetical protein
MVIRALIGFTLALIIASTAAAQDGARDPYDGGEKYWLVRPYKMTVIKAISIKKTGERDNSGITYETPGECAEFRPRESDIREFFLRARRVSYHTYWNIIDPSMCYAIGEVAFANGDRGVWRVDPARRGILTLSDGRNIYLFCTKCRGKIFYEY